MACASRNRRASWISVWSPSAQRATGGSDRGNNTDGLIPALDLFVLEDDRHYFPPYEGIAIIRQEVLKNHPEVGTALAALADVISDEDLRRLNYAVDGAHKDAAIVVRDFLRERKLAWDRIATLGSLIGNPAGQVFHLRDTLGAMDRRTFIWGATATAAAFSAPQLTPAAQSDLDPVFKEVEKRHDEAVKRLQTWIRQPSIAAENREVNEGCEAHHADVADAGFRW